MNGILKAIMWIVLAIIFLSVSIATGGLGAFIGWLFYVLCMKCARKADDSL